MPLKYIKDNSLILWSIDYKTDPILQFENQIFLLFWYIAISDESVCHVIQEAGEDCH